MRECRNNREKIQIMQDVLALARSGLKKTRICYRANLSYEQMHSYLEELISKGLIVQDMSHDGIVYRTTARGRQFLLCYARITALLEEDQSADLNAPYVTS
jgi:predicted transcriptional regulator